MTRKTSLKRFVISCGVAATFMFLIASCSSSDDEMPKDESSSSSQPANTGQMEAAHSMASEGSNSVAGITWAVPDGWVSAGQKPMRVETYFIDKQDAKAECAVYYFGPEQGGAVGANIERWINQMQMPDGSKADDNAMRGTVESECCKIATVEVAGTYNFSAGPMMKTQEQRPDYLLLGAVVDGPEGSVFFKLTGPKANAETFKTQFNSLLKSIKKS